MICVHVVPVTNELSGGVGIVFFDIDSTLSDMPITDRDDVINYCIYKGYDVGIITASNRPVWYLVNSNGTPNYNLSPWMTPTMADVLTDTNFETYNTMTLTGGKYLQFPNFPESCKMYGWKKGWQLNKAIEDGGYDRSKSYLLDDQVLVLQGVREVCSDVNLVLIDNTSIINTLDMSFIHRLLS
jgi:hypothetical protein